MVKVLQITKGRAIKQDRRREKFQVLIHIQDDGDQIIVYEQ
jgi:hypothetical protein